MIDPARAVLLRAPQKLTAGQKHILRLIRRDADGNGWTTVSKTVAPLFTDHKPWAISSELCDFERTGTGGRARLTALGNSIVDAMDYL